MILGDDEGAIEAYEHVVAILREDWGITEGETVEGCRQSIAQLRKAGWEGKMRKTRQS